MYVHIFLKQILLNATLYLKVRLRPSRRALRGPRVPPPRWPWPSTTLCGPMTDGKTSLSLSLLMITCRSAKMSNSFSFQENYIRLDQCLQYFKKKLKEIHNKTVNLTNFLNIVYIFSTKILNTVFVHKDFFSGLLDCLME